MFTPQEVSEKVFPKVSFGGYGMAAVDEFLDTLTEDYTSLYKENATLKAKLKVLAEKVEEYRATEDAMRSTLLSAQRMAAQMVEDARQAKEKVLEEARVETAAAVAAYEAQQRDAETRLALAKSELATFLLRARELCETQMAYLSRLPEMDLEEKPVKAEADTVAQLEQDILDSVAAEMEETPAVEEPAVEEAPEAEESVEETPVEEEPAAEEAPEAEEPFPVDFKLNLDELKFGRNYTGE